MLVACATPNRIKDAGYRRKQEGAFGDARATINPLISPENMPPLGGRAHLFVALMGRMAEVAATASILPSFLGLPPGDHAQTKEMRS